MSRDDSSLYSGLTSASFATPRSQAIKEQQEKQKQERLETQHKLKPAAEPVLELIEKHKQAFRYVMNVTTDDVMTDQEAGEMLRSQRRIYKFLMQFEQEIKIALRDMS